MTISFRSAPAAWVLALVVVTVSAGCSEDPTVTARKYAESADRYARDRQFKEAIIEYRNSLKTKPDTADVHYRLGRVYEESGDPVNAYAAYARAADLDPANVDAQMRAGTLLLVGREFEAARTRADLALKTDPKHAPAHILLGNAMAGLNETGSALRQIEQAINLDPSYAPAWTALGAVNFIGGRRSEAARAFEKAVELAPQSVDARLALANYQWAKADTAAAEATLKTALSIDQTNQSAHRALALLYVTTRRAPEAESHFRALAVDGAGKLALADYYMGVGRHAQALTVLGELEKSPEKSDARAARLRVASIHYGAGRKADAHQIVDALIQERPRSAEARTAKARMLLSDGASAQDALTHAREAVKADPDLPNAQYTLGLAALAARNTDEAERAFEATVRVTPRAAAAQMQLARIRLARGDAGAAVSAAELAVRHRPTDAEAAVLFAQTLRAQGNLDRAGRELSRRLASNPDSAPLHLEMGRLSLQRRDWKAARAAFQQALRVAPSSLDARAGLVAAEIGDQKVDVARAQVDTWRQAAPSDHTLGVLAGKVEIAAGDHQAAEGILREVLSRDASRSKPTSCWAHLRGAGQGGSGVQQYKAMAQRSPSSAASALTLIGNAGRDPEGSAAARAAYKRTLAGDPKAGVAANNLAGIYAEEGKLDDALRLALVAQQVLKRRPEADDTVGWIYFQKGLPLEAIAAFERLVSARRRTRSITTVGLAHMKTGQRDRARSAFARALGLGPDFAGADDPGRRWRRWPRPRRRPSSVSARPGTAAPPQGAARPRCPAPRGPRSSSPLLLPRLPFVQFASCCPADASLLVQRVAGVSSEPLIIEPGREAIVSASRAEPGSSWDRPLRALAQ